MDWLLEDLEQRLQRNPWGRLDVSPELARYLINALKERDNFYEALEGLAGVGPPHCLVARPGETTLECRHNSLCFSCRAHVEQDRRVKLAELAEDRRSRAKAAEADATASRLEMFAAKRASERWKKAAAYYRYKDQVAAKLASDSLKRLTEERDRARQWAGLWKKIAKRFIAHYKNAQRNQRPRTWWYPADPPRAEVIYENEEGDSMNCFEEAEQMTRNNSQPSEYEVDELGTCHIDRTVDVERNSLDFCKGKWAIWVGVTCVRMCPTKRQALAYAKRIREALVEVPA